MKLVTMGTLVTGTALLLCLTVISIEKLEKKERESRDWFIESHFDDWTFPVMFQQWRSCWNVNYSHATKGNEEMIVICLFRLVCIVFLVWEYTQTLTNSLWIPPSGSQGFISRHLRLKEEKSCFCFCECCGICPDLVLICLLHFVSHGYQWENSYVTALFTSQCLLDDIPTMSVCFITDNFHIF